MALMADKQTSKMLENRFNEFTEYGMTLYYLLEEGRLNIKDLESILFSKDDEKSSFIYGKILKHTKPSDFKDSYNKYCNEYEKSNQDDETTIKENLNLLYTKKIIDVIVSQEKNKIDKTFVNTYKYLLSNKIK